MCRGNQSPDTGIIELTPAVLVELAAIYVSSQTKDDRTESRTEHNHLPVKGIHTIIVNFIRWSD